MKKWIVLFIVAFGSIIWFGIHTYQNAFDYRNNKSMNAIQLAEKEVPNLEVQDVTYYNGNEAYTIIFGKTENDEEKIICVPKNKNLDIISVNEEDGISAKDAAGIVMEERNPVEIKSVNLGVEQNVPIWEVIYIDDRNRYSYYYVTFEDGQFIKRYTL